VTVLVVLESILLAVLTVLVAGLLRAYATVLRRLHELDGGGHGAQQFRLDAAAPVATPASRDAWTEGHDIAGETVGGELVSTRVIGVEHDTVLLFLSSGCASCETFWDELAQPARLPPATRLVVITQGEDAESRRAVGELAPSGLDVIMSTPAWREYEVPGSPHVVFVEGRTGRVRGEGTGQSWGQVAQMLARATGDTTFLSGAASAPPRAAKPARDAEVEAEVDRELMAAGILPGDPRLYGSDG
jgi:hypothetical protein